MKKFIAVAQKSGKYFMHAAGVVGAVCMIVGAFVVIAPYIGLPLGGGIGLVWAIVGAKKALNQLKEEEDKHTQRMKALGSLAYIKKDLRELTEEVRDDLEDLKEDLVSHQHHSEDEEPVIGKKTQFTTTDSDSDSDTAGKKPPKESPFTVVSRLAHKQQREINHVFRFFKRKKVNAKPANLPVFTQTSAAPSLISQESTVRIHL